MKSKTYFPITASENVSYGFTLHGLPDNIYARKCLPLADGAGYK